MVMINRASEDVSTPSEHAFLDQAYDYLQSGEAGRAKDVLFAALTRIRRHLNTREWELYLSRVCLVHPVHRLIHSDHLQSRPGQRRWTCPADNEPDHSVCSPEEQQGPAVSQSCLLCIITDLLGQS